MKFSEKIKKLRQDNELTQEELAEKLYVTRTAISKWETDKGYPGIDSLKQLSSLFHISIDDMISDSDIENKRLLEEKKARQMYMVAIIFLGIATVFTLLAYFLKNSYFHIGGLIGLVGYIAFGILTKPKSDRIAARKTFVPYVISRIMLLIIVIVIIATTVIQLK